MCTWYKYNTGKGVTWCQYNTGKGVHDVNIIQVKVYMM
jgi:hypothetical protein